MAKRSLMSLPGKVGGLMNFWKHLRSLQVAEIAGEAARPFSLAAVGSDDAVDRLIARLERESPAASQPPRVPGDVRAHVQRYRDSQSAPRGTITIDADRAAGDEVRLAEALARIVAHHPKLRLSLARHIPAFRPAVAAQLISDASWQNAKIAVVSALPGVIPLTDFLLPATALGDMVILTRNQAVMLLRIAAAYGHTVDLRERTKELLPIVGSAFGWRAVARELVGMVPGGIGLVIKGSVAYAGTYAVGKAAAIYYGTGQSLSGDRLKKLYDDALGGAGVKVKQWLRKGRPQDEPAGELTASDVLEAENASSGSGDFAENLDKNRQIGV